MIEDKELKYVITTQEGKMIAGYNKLKDAELDAEDICASKRDKKFHIYELTNSMALAETVLQKTYQLKTTYPLPEPEPEPEPEAKAEDKTEEKSDK